MLIFKKHKHIGNKMISLRVIENDDLKEILAKSKEYQETNGASGQIADLRLTDLSDKNLKNAILKDADLRAANLICAWLSFADLSGADLSCSDLHFSTLTGTNLTGADLRGASMIGASLGYANLKDAILSDTPSPSPIDLCKSLLAHAKSDRFNQDEWCGTCCCLAGAAGALIGNQPLGVALIRQVLPEFNTSVLYQSVRHIAVNELKRVAALHGVAS